MNTKVQKKVFYSKDDVHNDPEMCSGNFALDIFPTYFKERRTILSSITIETQKLPKYLKVNQTSGNLYLSHIL
jgi:hypothetical protein